MKLKKIEVLKNSAKSLKIELENIIDEHDSYAFSSEKEASDWINSFIIEDLHDLKAFEDQIYDGKWHLSDIKIKSNLRKSYDLKKEELEKVISDLRIEIIENLQVKISENY